MLLSETLSAKTAKGETAFVAYLTAGDPSASATHRFVRTLSRAGVSVIELGVPHSDPVADGPTNAKAAERALKNGTSLRDVMGLVKELRAAGENVPLVLFTYLNPILKMGISNFAALARESGVSGVLVVDLPPEAAGEYLAEMKTKGIQTVFLCSPTTRPDRLSRIAESSTGFVYYVSRTGVTGVQNQLAGQLKEKVLELKKLVKKPVCVGFGVSTAAQVREIGLMADGVVVGSCLVDIIEKASSVDEANSLLEKKVNELMEPIRGTKKESQC